MKILLVSQYFWPESFRINDLADELVKRGHDVWVLTGKPNYPQGRIYKKYHFWGYEKENRDGINIIRVPLIPRGNGSGIRLALNYMSFVLFSCLYILFHKKKYDVSLTFAISPITQVFAALLHKRLYGGKTFIWIQDLWPESVIAAGKMNSGLIYAILNQMVQWIYKNVDGICVQSEAFKDSILAKGVDEAKISYIPNWAEDIFIDKEKIDKGRFKELIPPGFIVMFAGNIGEAQDFESILQAAVCTKDHKEIKWIIVGDGRKKEFVEKKIIEFGISDTCILLGRYPLNDMPDLFIHADLMLVTLKNKDIFSLTIPSKIQSYMAFGKPIVSMINGIGNEIITDANCGLTAVAGDSKMLSENVVRLSQTEASVLNHKGENGYVYYKQYFSKESIINNLLKEFQYH